MIKLVTLHNIKKVKLVKKKLSWLGDKWLKRGQY